MNDCSYFSQLIDSVLDNTVSDIEKAEFEKHICECSNCRNDYEFTKKLVASLHSLPPIDVPEDFLDNINKKIDMGKRIRFLSNRKICSVVAAGLMLSVIIGSNPWRTVRQSSEPVVVSDTSKDKPESTHSPQTEGQTDDTPAQAPIPVMTPQPTSDQAPVVIESGKVTQQTTTGKKPSGSTKPGSVSDKSKNKKNSDPRAVKDLYDKAQVSVDSGSDSTNVVNTNIALPSDKYVISEESDEQNSKSIEKSNKLQQSYALVQSIDNMVYSPDVMKKIRDDENIIVDDAVFVCAVDGDTSALSSSIIISNEDSENVRQLLSDSNIKSDGTLYFMSGTELEEILDKLKDMNIEFKKNMITNNDQIVLKLVTT